jgi:hypothetical protein
MIFCAITSPMPGKALSSSLLATFISNNFGGTGSRCPRAVVPIDLTSQRSDCAPRSKYQGYEGSSGKRLCQYLDPFCVTRWYFFPLTFSLHTYTDDLSSRLDA